MPLKILKNKTLFSNSINEIRDSITEKNAEIKYEIKNYKSLGIKASKDELEKLIDENEIWLKFLSAPLMRLFDNYYDYKNALCNCF